MFNLLICQLDILMYGYLIGSLVVAIFRLASMDTGLSLKGNICGNC